MPSSIFFKHTNGYQCVEFHITSKLFSKLLHACPLASAQSCNSNSSLPVSHCDLQQLETLLDVPAPRLHDQILSSLPCRVLMQD